MYIEPNTTIRLLRNIKIDNSYENTIYFSSKSAQYNYFVGKTKYVLDYNSYQRHSKGRMRIQLLADNIYDCNYMMFQNSSYNNKWFYAFITNVEYINNVTSEITYEIDVMQTWFLDCTLGVSYVEREHTVTDEIGEHINPEPVDTGDFVCESMEMGADFSTYDIVIAMAKSTGDSGISGGTVPPSGGSPMPPA